MKIEHIAFNVAVPREMADWYAEHFQMRVVRKMESGPLTHFLVDDDGTTIIEIYNNPADQVPNYAAMDPLLFHLAFSSQNPVADQTRLMAAGATLVENLHLEDGSHLVMMRDPWGLAVQLCKRAKPLISSP
jgi:catechol 2,3-dioxygenase-like lactoylglutathione lyase family enzyme